MSGRTIPPIAFAAGVCVLALTITGCSELWPEQTAPPTPGGTVTVTMPVTVTPPAAPQTRVFDLAGPDDWAVVAFASPAGAIQCGISSSSVVCSTENVDEYTVPLVKDCGGPDDGNPPIRAQQVELTESAIPTCYNDAPFVTEIPDGQDPPEWVQVGVGELETLAGHQIAVLPFGHALQNRNFLCTSELYGITCVNLNSHHGMLLRAAGLVTF